MAALSGLIDWLVGFGLLIDGAVLIALLLARHFGWTPPAWFPFRETLMRWIRPNPKRLERVVALFPARMRG